jgi:hypothetical protein
MDRYLSLCPSRVGASSTPQFSFFSTFSIMLFQEKLLITNDTNDNELNE